MSAEPSTPRGRRPTPAAPVELNPIDSAKAQVEEAHNAVQRAAAALAEAKAKEAAAIEAFVVDVEAGPARVEALAHRERAEVIHARAQQAEAAARKVLDDLVRAERVRAYEAAVIKATHVGARLGPALAKLAKLEAQVRELVDGEIADAVADQHTAVTDAEQLHAVLGPPVALHARGVARLSMLEARYLGQVWLAHQRSAAGLDDLPDGWVDGTREPNWNEPGRDAWVRACRLLGITPTEQTP
jgi:hypothetical protein